MARMFNWLTKASTAQSILGGTVLTVSGGIQTSKDDIYNGITFTEDGHIISHGIDFFSITNVTVDSEIVTKGNAALKALIDAANTTYDFSVSNDTITITPSVGGVSQTAQTLKISGVSNATTKAALTLQIQGVTKNTFNGSSGQTFNVTRQGLGITSGSDSSEKILTALLPFSSEIPTFEDNTILSNFAIRQLITAAKSEAMHYKGTFTTTLPIPDQVGDIYKYAGTDSATFTINGGSVKLEPGDTIICETISSTKTYTWSVIQTNANIITSNINRTNQRLYGTGTGFTIYAPTTAGTKGQVLISSGGTPSWGDVSVLNTIDDAGTLITTIKLGTYSFASDSVDIIANKLQNALTFSSGLSATYSSYDGSYADTIKVALVDETKNSSASTTSSTSLRSVILDSNGNLAMNLSSYITKIYMGASSTSTYSTSATGTSGGYIILGNGNSAKTSLQISGASGITVGYSPSSLTISGNLANTTSQGQVPAMTNLDTETRVDDTSLVLTTNSSGTMSWLHLPANSFNNTNTWRAVTINGNSFLGTATSTKTLNFVEGNNISLTGNSGTLTISTNNRNIQVNGTTYLVGTNHDTLNFINGTHTTAKYTSKSFTFDATWRPVAVEGTTKLSSTGSTTLNFVASESIYPLMDSSSQLGFDLMWFNIDTGTYERL